MAESLEFKQKTEIREVLTAGQLGGWLKATYQWRVRKAADLDYDAREYV